jgi:serine/threonine-protein kinase RsbW
VGSDARHPSLQRLLDVMAKDVPTASAWLKHACDELGVPEDQLIRLDLCLNEALANVISHGGESACAVPLRLTLEVADSEIRSATLTVSDAGKPFNPVVATTAPRPARLADTPPGGLGLVMMRKFSDHIGYANRDGRNHVAFTVHWTGAA